MAKELDTSDPVVRAIFLGMGGLLWLALCFRLITRWHVVPPGHHAWFIGLALIVPLLWHSLVKDKISLSSMTGVTLLLMTVVKLAVQSRAF